MVMGSEQRRERDRQEMREAILRAAIKLFAEESFEKVTMRRIAEAIDYTPGTLYWYFKDKDEIVFALHQRGFEMLFARQVPTLSIADPVERLRKLAEVYIDFALENPQYYDLMFINSATGRCIERDEGSWKAGEAAFGVLRETVRQVIESGRMRGTSDPDVAAYACWAAVHGIASLRIRNRCGMLPEEDRERILREAAGLYSQLTKPAPDAP
jgi:AcrR family transcriptional regulator